MQDNSQPDAEYNHPNAGYTNPQEQHVPFDDQMTVAVPQGAGAPPLYYEQGFAQPGAEQTQQATLPQGAGAPPLYYEQGPGFAQPGPWQMPQTTPQRKRAISPRLLIGVGALVIVLLLLGIAGVVFLPGLLAPTSNQTTASTSAATPGAQARKNVYAPYLVQYRGTIRDQIAQGLHLSSTQLQTQLSSGQTLSSIAAAQNVSASQLQTIVTNAFQNAFQPALSGGNLTQKQVDALIKRMLKQPKALDRYLAAQVHIKKGVNATPTAINQ